MNLAFIGFMVFTVIVVPFVGYISCPTDAEKRLHNILTKKDQELSEANQLAEAVCLKHTQNSYSVRSII